ncbi:hypothetical protein CathTA2_1495 [Caldalkalibacillus thermarum TA2.A1]|uniref:HesB/YadR/YfhF-family protein n=1 Tax=Caldalkalibacillus thermarum (strain TA2.A1) TaxID=986075 RepID=F5L6P5_CALTT|nr:CC/Se motif family (seleno)protein [Caldalkalibacillus thermarum]EGL82996.1 hypothetical protein CathTA2_1495 [Caldalkalibacillus thermarum TA2.A1]QZT34591.1 hypothetical protein HUR95_04295 [Caldalkalibacillus thermarum TA2.A1]
MILHVQLEERAKNWLVSKGKMLTVQLLKARGCCGGGPMELTTRLGEPDDPQRFKEIQVDDLRIFVPYHIEQFLKEDELQLKLWGLGPFKSIVVANRVDLF